MNLNAIESNIIPKFNYRDLIIFIVPILLFSLYLFVYSPGVLTVSSYSQLHQIATGQFTNAHQMFHTLLEIICLKIFKSPFYIGLFQILIFSAMWMVICKYHRDDTLGSSDEFVMQFIVTLIICLIPINAVYSITLSSNILFSYSLMFLCFLIKVMIDKNGHVNTKLIVLMAVTIAVMSGLSSYGIYIAILSLVPIIYYLIKKNNPQNTLVLLAGITIVCILLIGSLGFIFHVENDSLDIKTNDAFKEGINLENAKNQFFSKINSTPSNEIENIASANIGNSNYNILDSIVNPFRGSILGGLFCNPTLYMIFSLVLLVLIYSITKTEEIFLIYVPPILNLGFVVLTGQNNLYANLLLFYLLIIISISILVKLGFNLNDISGITQNITNPKEIETPKVPPVIEREENDENTYYSDLELELEDLTLDDINEMLGKTPEDALETEELPQEGDSDLIDEILKEIEMEKK